MRGICFSPVQAWKRFHSVFDGNLAGIPPTGKQVSVEALTLFRVAGEKIVEMWDCWDA